MAFTPKQWRNGQIGATPLDAAGLTDLEQRLADYIDSQAQGTGAELSDILDAVALKQSLSEKGQPNGYAGLGSDGKVLTAQLPPFSSNTVFNVKDVAFGAVGDGVADDFTAISNALAACIAAGGGIVYLPAGTYYLNPSAPLVLPTALTKLGSVPVTLRGVGRGATTIKLSAGAPSLFAYPTGGDFSNLVIEDLLVDCNNVPSPSYNYTGVVLGYAGRGTVTDLRIERVDTINVGNSRTASVERRNIDLTITNDAYDMTTLYECRRIKIKDCKLGKTGGGGNYGVVLQGYTGSQRLMSKAMIGNPPLVNVYFDEIEVDNLYWMAGNVPAAGSLFSGSGVMIGGSGYGDRVRIRNCTLGQSTDNCIEVDSCRDVVIEDCLMTDSVTGGLFLTNLGGIYRQFGQTIKVRNCRYVLNQRSNANGKGFSVYQNNGSSYGSVHFEDCIYEQVGNVPIQGSFNFHGDFDLLSVRRCRTHYRSGTATATSNSQGLGCYGMRAELLGGKGRVVVEDMQLKVEDITIATGTFTGTRFEMSGVILDQGTDHDIDVRGVNMSTGAWTVTGTGTPVPAVRTRHVYLQSGHTVVSTDNMGSTTLLTSNYLDDTAQLANTVATGGVLTATGSYTSERRFTYLQDTNFDYGTIGPFTDGSVYVKVNPSATLAGFKAGTLKRIRQDTYLGAYVIDDGTTSYLCLDKVLDGTRTALLTAGSGGAVAFTPVDATVTSGVGIPLGTRLANGTSGWIRLLCRADAVQADWFTASAPTIATTGATTASVTLTGSDREKLGQGIQGRPAFTWVPMGADATLDDFSNQRMNVIRGRISGLSFGKMEQRVNDGWAVQFGATSTGNSATRVVSMEIEDVDMSGAKGATSFTDIAGFDATQGQAIRRARITYAGSAPAPAAITAPASGVAYVNQDGYTEDVYFYGGTLTTPFLEVARSQGAAGAAPLFGQVLGANGPAMVRLEPGDSVRATYSAAPTMRKIPVL